MISEIQKMLAAGSIVYGALFTAMVFGAAMAWGNPIAVILALLSAGVSYLSYAVSFAYYDDGLPKLAWLKMAHHGLSSASIVVAIVAAAALLVG